MTGAPMVLTPSVRRPDRSGSMADQHPRRRRDAQDLLSTNTESRGGKGSGPATANLSRLTLAALWITLVATLLAACAPAVPVASSLPSATPTPASSPTARATASLSPAAAAAAHITKSVTELMNLQGNDAIEAWINRESAWVDTPPSLPILRPYVAAIASALIDLIYQDETTDLALTALKIIDAARQVPGVDLP